MSITNVLYHENKEMSTVQVEKYDSYKAEVVRETPSGCIISLEVNGAHIPAYTYGNFSVGDELWVTVLKVFTDRYPLTYVDSVLTYASEAVA